MEFDEYYDYFREMLYSRGYDGLIGGDFVYSEYYANGIDYYKAVELFLNEEEN